MKHTERFSAFDTNGGKYSSRKIPQWRMGHKELLEYMDFMANEGDDTGYHVQQP